MQNWRSSSASIGNDIGCSLRSARAIRSHETTLEVTYGRLSDKGHLSGTASEAST